MTRPLIYPVKIIGYAPHNSILDPEVLALYSDYPVGREIPVTDFKRELDFGYVPVGTLIQIGTGAVAKVTGASNNLQVVPV